MAQMNPFPGLRRFEADESHLFFGREKATDELLRRLRTHRFIAVVGTSGSGKSSLVRAGMLPDLYGGFMVSAGSDWRVAIMRPGDRPIRALAKALSAPSVLGRSDAEARMRQVITETVLQRGALGLVDVMRQARLPKSEHLLVVVDQFEELFRIGLGPDSKGTTDEAVAFVKLLLEAVGQVELPIYVMLTMRSEYLGDCTRFRDLPEAINDGQYLIPRMTRDQRSQAILGPVAVGGATITHRLVQRLLNDVGDNPDQLPILQHAMMRTWSFWEQERQLDEPIDLRHYQATGGMEEALSRHADEAFEELADDRGKQIAQAIFKRLTGKSDDNREMRQPTRLQRLCEVAKADEGQVIAVIDVFRRKGRSFLMPQPQVALNGNSVIDISHESLIRIWRRLKEWVEEEAQSARVYRRLAETAALRDEGKAGLWRDPDLQIALSWCDRVQPNQAWAERYHPRFREAMQFLDTSRTAARRRKLMGLVPAVGVPALVLALGCFKAYEILERRKLEAIQQVQQEKQAEIVQKQAKLDEIERQNQQIAQEKEEITQVAESAQADLEEREQRIQVAEQAVKELKVKVSETLLKVDDAAQQLTEVDGERAPAQEIQVLANTMKEEVAKLKQQAEQKLEVVSESGDSEPVAVIPVAEIAALEIDASPSSGEAKAVEIVLSSLDTETVSTALVSAGGEIEPAEQAAEGPMNPVRDAVAPSSCDDKLLQIKRLAENPEKTVTAKFQALQAVAGATDCAEALSLAESGIVSLQAIINNSATIMGPEDFVTCRQVKGVEPKGIANSFSPGNKVYMFARVNAPRTETLTLQWLKADGREFSNRSLRIKRNLKLGFRTFSWKMLRERGDYEVRLYNEANSLIGRRQFSVR